MAKIPRLTLVEGDEPNLLPEMGQMPSEADPPLESAGQELRTARQLKGKDLADVWRVLRIRPDYLVAIEESRFESLPDRAHTLGFVRSYAAYLGLDAKEIVGRMKVEMAAARGSLDEISADQTPEIEPAPPPDAPPIARPNTAPAVDFLQGPDRESPRIAPVIAVAVLVGIISFGYYVAGPTGDKPQQSLEPIPTQLAAVAESVQQPSAAPPHVEQPAPAPQPEPALASPKELPPTEPVTVRPTPKLLATLPPGQHYGYANKTSRITLRVHNATRVTVEGARKHVFIDRVLEPGDTYRVPNQAGLKLSASNAGAIEFLLDGTSTGFAGEEGASAAGLSLNPQTILARQHHG